MPGIYRGRTFVIIKGLQIKSGHRIQYPLHRPATALYVRIQSLGDRHPGNVASPISRPDGQRPRIRAVFRLLPNAKYKYQSCMISSLDSERLRAPV